MTRLTGSSKLLRAMNQSAALELLLDRGTLTRAELRELTGLSKPTISDVLRTLTQAGYATIVGHTSGGPGPNAEIYAVNPAAGYVAAVSVRDGTETDHLAISAALCDLTGTVLAQADYPNELADEPVQAVVATVDDLCARAGVDPAEVTHVQLGVPGSYHLGNDTIHHIDVPGWDRPGLIGELSVVRPTTAENDVNLAAIAERSRGVAAGTGGFALVWFGAGLGCAVDLGDTLLRGATGSAGEIGYLPARLGNAEAPADLQDLVGGPAVLALALAHGFTVSTPQAAVAQAVTQDAPAAGAFLRELAARIALALTSVAAILDPPLLVLAGEVALAGGAKLRDLVAEAFHHTSPMRTPVAVTGLAEDAVLLGALDAGLRTVRESLVDSLRHP